MISFSFLYGMVASRLLGVYNGMAVGIFPSCMERGPLWSTLPLVEGRPLGRRGTSLHTLFHTLWRLNRHMHFLNQTPQQSRAEQLQQAYTILLVSNPICLPSSPQGGAVHMSYHLKRLLVHEHTYVFWCVLHPQFLYTPVWGPG